ncbi:MAG: hypothetical protein J6T15_04920 [Bacilli bacterium]|nr:hypothetical protein [Bacilli bacterium]
MSDKEKYFILFTLLGIIIAMFIIYICLISEINDIKKTEEEPKYCNVKIEEGINGDVFIMNCVPKSIYKEVVKESIEEKTI